MADPDKRVKSSHIVKVSALDGRRESLTGMGEKLGEAWRLRELVAVERSDRPDTCVDRRAGMLRFLAIVVSDRSGREEEGGTGGDGGEAVRDLAAGRGAGGRSGGRASRRGAARISEMREMRDTHVIVPAEVMPPAAAEVVEPAPAAVVIALEAAALDADATAPLDAVWTETTADALELTQDDDVPWRTVRCVA